MKTPVLTGVIGAFVMCLWTLVQFFVGWHNENLELSDKLGPVNWVVWVVVGIIAMYATRAGLAPTEKFSYGRALGSAVISLLAFGVVSAIFTALYFTVINPDFASAFITYKTEQMAKMGVPAQNIDGARMGMEMMFRPAFISIFSFLSPLLVGIIPSLLAAIVVRRQGTDPVATA